MSINEPILPQREPWVTDPTVQPNSSYTPYLKGPLKVNNIPQNSHKWIRQKLILNQPTETANLWAFISERKLGFKFQQFVNFGHYEPIQFASFDLKLILQIYNNQNTLPLLTQQCTNNARANGFLTVFIHQESQLQTPQLTSKYIGNTLTPLCATLAKIHDIEYNYGHRKFK